MKDFPLDSWTKKRCFSEFEAELDYILNRDENGKVDITIRELAKRWGWNYVKVYRYINKASMHKSVTDFEIKVKHLFGCSSDTYIASCNKNVTKTETKAKQVKVNKSSTIYKEKFDEIYQNKFKEPFYWAAKEVVGIRGIIKQLQFGMKNKGTDITEESTMEAFVIFLDNIQDKWILEHFSPSIINSKFNEIVSSIKMSKSKTGIVLHNDNENKFKQIKTW